MNQEQIILNCKAGNRLAQKLLYEKYSKQMYRICLRYCRRSDMAADAMQNGFVKVFKSISNFKGDGEIGAWIRVIVIRSCLDIIRVEKISLFSSIDELIEVRDWNSEDFNLDSFDYDRMLKHLEKLPEGYRIVFTMKILDELSHKEIALALNISENTSRTQLLKARKMLQKSFSSDEYLMSQYKRS